jgi:uncharacterized protein YqeY
MNLKDRIQEDMKNAMRAQDKQRLSAIRLILAAIKQYEVDKRVAVDDTIATTILDKMIKQRRDSITQYQTAKRQDLVDQESFEVELIQAYLPTPLTAAEIDAFITSIVTATGATSAKDMGKVMAELKTKLQGRADMAVVGAKVKERLG